MCACKLRSLVERTIDFGQVTGKPITYESSAPFLKAYNNTKRGSNSVCSGDKIVV